MPPSPASTIGLTLLATIVFSVATRPVSQIPLDEPPSVASLLPILVSNFESDQSAVLRLQHREHVISKTSGKPEDARTNVVWYINGHAISETVALDDRALAPIEVALEHQRAMDRANQARLRPPTPSGSITLDHEQYPFRKIAADFVYGSGTVREWQGRTTWVYPAAPNPHAAYSTRTEEVLAYSQGELWVDAQDLHVVRLTASNVSPIRYLLGMAAIIHHAHFDLQMQRHTAGEWFPSYGNFEMDATVAMVRSVRRSRQQTYSDYISLSQ